MTVWNTLSPVDVNEHTDEKNKFTYLSWTYAWKFVKDKYPDATYEQLPDDVYADGSMCVNMSVTIDGLTHRMWLAVTDFKNKPIPNPSCDFVANARMRCLVKAIGMHGLGFYIYAGESLPMDVGLSDEFREDLLRMLGAEKPVEFAQTWRNMEEEAQQQFFSSFQRGHIGKMKDQVREAINNYNGMIAAYINGLLSAVEDQDPVAAEELTTEMDTRTKQDVWAGLNDIQQQQIKDLIRGAA